MRIPLDSDSSTPIYRQIEMFLAQSITSGKLPVETRLPAARQLASSLGVSRITVDSAYAELEASGLVARRSGSGTYVLPLYVTTASPAGPSQQQWPLWQQDLRPSKTLGITSPPPPVNDSDQISFAEGGGDPLLFPLPDFRKALYATIRDADVAALEYGDTAGYWPLRQTIAQILTSQGVGAKPENILITSGSQQALALTLQVLLQPGDVVLAEQPTYGKALQLFAASRLQVAGIPMDEEGMRVDLLEGILQEQRPRLIYTIPNFHNPTGTCLSSHRRRHLLSLASRYNVPVFEDDYVGDLRFEGSSRPALKSLDKAGHVVYTSTFSKMLMPGIRVGFVVADGPIFPRLVHAKETSDLATSNLLQRALQEYISVGRYQTHLRKSCLLYKKRRDMMLKAVAEILPPEAEVVLPPQGGLFLWLKLPPGVLATTLISLAREEGLTLAPGTTYFAKETEGEHFLRMNFACLREEDIVLGMRRLKAAMTNY